MLHTKDVLAFDSRAEDVSCGRVCRAIARSTAGHTPRNDLSDVVGVEEEVARMTWAEWRDIKHHSWSTTGACQSSPGARSGVSVYLFCTLAPRFRIGQLTCSQSVGWQVDDGSASVMVVVSGSISGIWLRATENDRMESHREREREKMSERDRDTRQSGDMLGTSECTRAHTHVCNAV